MSNEIDVREAYPLVATLLGGYLHQDFHFEHGSVDGAIDAFLETIDATERKRFAGEMASLLTQFQGAALDRAIDEMGNDYDYRHAGYEASAWLAAVAQRVTVRRRE
ncbi:MAG: hypothetical protein NVS2B3_11410 [Vulcanimicrobiaceae bacterium]